MAPETDLAMKIAKHHFMAYRNGIIADTLRKAGQPYSIIFGLQLPQLSHIARELEPSVQLGKALWEDRNVRESRLLAAYLYPASELTFGEAFAMASAVLTREEADILAFRLLRHLPYADRLATRLLESGESLTHYAGEALLRNLQS